MKITSKVETITPAKAALWLNGLNTHNRHLSIKHANRLAAAMKSDHWVTNGSPIIFDDNGVLVDGQHRLKAIVISGRSIVGVVTRGVPDTAFPTIDHNKTRSIGDVFDIRGIPQAHRVATTAGLITRIRRDGYYRQSAQMPLRHEVMDMFEMLDKERLYESVRYGDRLMKALGGGGLSLYAAVHYLSPNLATVDDFWEQIESGVGLNKESPARLFRNYVFSQTRGNHRWEPQAQYTALVKCLNAHIEGKPMKILKVVEDEQPPVIYKIRTHK